MDDHDPTAAGLAAANRFTRLEEYVDGGQARALSAPLKGS
jgi:hypothetical protein